MTSLIGKPQAPTGLNIYVSKQGSIEILLTWNRSLTLFDEMTTMNSLEYVIYGYFNTSDTVSIFYRSTTEELAHTIYLESYESDGNDNIVSICEHKQEDAFFSVSAKFAEVGEGNMSIPKIIANITMVTMLCSPTETNIVYVTSSTSINIMDVVIISTVSTICTLIFLISIVIIMMVIIVVFRKRSMNIKTNPAYVFYQPNIRLHENKTALQQNKTALPPSSTHSPHYETINNVDYSLNNPPYDTLWRKDCITDRKNDSEVKVALQHNLAYETCRDISRSQETSV